MSDVKEFFSDLFNQSLWPPRWHCGYWSDFHGWLYIISDLMIWAAYFTIPVLILQYILKRKNIRFHKAYISFAAFILMCGMTHLNDATMFWVPMYRLNALMRFFTALVSWLTVYQLFKLLPKISATKTSMELESEIERNNLLLKELEKSNIELKKQNALVENLFNATIDHANVFDLQLNLVTVNKVTEKYLNKRKEEILGKNFNDLFPESIGSEYHMDLKAAASGSEIINKISVALNQHYYESSFKPLFENDVQYGVLVISRDITDKVTKEIALELLNKELNTKNELLAKSNAELENFTFILSHDLQEPLRKIQIYSDLASKASDGNKNIQIGKVMASADRMKALIVDVLDYARADKVDAVLEKVNLDEILNGVLVDLELSISEKKAVISSKPIPEIQGIKYQLTQVFYNLISNALKYCDKEPCLEITHEVVTKRLNNVAKNYIEISFKDNGIGFEEQYKTLIFTPFKRLETRFAGTGIGLALVKRIVENHNGYIDVESKLGEGSIFKIGLPL